MLPTKFSQSDFVVRDGHYWMTAHDLGVKLGYSLNRTGVNNIYNRNKVELEPFTCVINLSTQGEKQERWYRCFDEQGCYIVAMLAKTPQAKTFRKALAMFLKDVRSNICSLQQEYFTLRHLVAGERLKRYLQNSRSFSEASLERLVYLKASGLLSNSELSKIFEVCEAHLNKIIKLHREAQGDFKNRQPRQLQAGRV